MCVLTGHTAAQDTEIRQSGRSHILRFYLVQDKSQGMILPQEGRKPCSVPGFSGMKIDGIRIRKIPEIFVCGKIIDIFASVTCNVQKTRHGILGLRQDQYGIPVKAVSVDIFRIIRDWQVFRKRVHGNHCIRRKGSGKKEIRHPSGIVCYKRDRFGTMKA